MALGLFSYISTRKGNELLDEPIKMKNKVPISENNISKPIDKLRKKVYNDANERRAASEKGMTAIRRNYYGNQIQEAHHPYGHL